MFLNRILVFSFLSCFSVESFAWGERGHQMITRVAAHLVEAKHARTDPAFAELIRTKAYMLAHLSNIPDTYWRSLEEPARSANAPTHFIDLEFILKGNKKPAMADLPIDWENYLDSIAETCKVAKDDCARGPNMEAKISSTGHALFRADELYRSLVAELSKLESRKSWNSESVSQVQRSLELAGLLSHFIGDLANPMHTSKNYNGQLTGQTGLHSYFETLIVERYDLAIDQMAYEYALRRQPVKELSKTWKQDSAKGLVMALILDSFYRLDHLLELDKSYSLKATGDAFIQAQRVPPASVKEKYKALVVERLAFGASVLAELWYQAWLEAARPSLDGYRSYDYSFTVDFIEPSYVNQILGS